MGKHSSNLAPFVPAEIDKFRVKCTIRSPAGSAMVFDTVVLRPDAEVLLNILVKSMREDAVRRP